MRGTAAFISHEKTWLCLRSPPVRLQCESAVHNPEEGSHQNWTMLVPSEPSAQISGLQNSLRNKFVVCKLPSLGCC